MGFQTRLDLCDLFISNNDSVNITGKSTLNDNDNESSNDGLTCSDE